MRALAITTAVPELTAAAQLQDVVSFTGALPREGALRWLQLASAAALPSYREGCPNVVLEAMACGVPVVAAQVGEVATMLPPFAGTMVPADAMLALLASSLDEALGRPWDRAAIGRYAEEHSWHGVAREVLDVWHRAVGER